MYIQLVAVNAEWLVDSMDHLSPLISKEWIGLILLPTVSVMAGECMTPFMLNATPTYEHTWFDRMCHGCQRRRTGPAHTKHQRGGWLYNRAFRFTLKSP